ncbi:dynein heavy chain, partial [Kipferlia bialata]
AVLKDDEGYVVLQPRPGLIREISFWHDRAQDLFGVSRQLASRGVRATVEVLEAARSSYVTSFGTLSAEIGERTRESHSNLGALGLIEEDCAKMNKAAPDEILECILPIVRCGHNILYM